MLTTNFSIYHLEFYLLVAARVLGACATAPIYGMRGVPRNIKLGLALGVALAVSVATPYEPLNYETLIEFTILLVKEIILGLSVGLAATLCMSIINLSGMFIDREIGFTMVTMFDPTTNSNATITADFYNYLVLLMMLATNMHHFIIRAICDSFTVIPVGGIQFSAQAYRDIVPIFLQEYFVIAFRIALPIFISITLVNVVLGVLAKTSPQMNMFSVGIELKLIIGLMVLIVLVSFIPNITDFVYQATQELVYDFIEALSGA